VSANGHLITLALQKVSDIRLTAEPLNKRAWALQERLLPPRILSFLSEGALLDWECDSAWESNIGPIEYPFGSSFRIFSPILPRHSNPPDPPA
jgi:hypothetical protein